MFKEKKIFVHNILTKKYSFKGNIKEKKFMLVENFPPPPPPFPPHNFSNGPSLKLVFDGTNFF